MKNAKLKILGSTLVTLTTAAILGAAGARATGNIELWEAGLWWVTDPIEGLWDAKVTICVPTGGARTFDAKRRSRGRSND
jgi:hypothetical protein